MDRVVIAIVAFFLGSTLMLFTWQESAERGIFEVGSKVYRAERVQP